MQLSKRVLALVMALCLCLSLVLSVAAADPMPAGDPGMGGMGGDPGMGGGMPPDGMGGPGGDMGGGGMGGGASVSEADLAAAEAIVNGPYTSLTITAVEYDPTYADYVDSTIFAQITKVVTDQGEFAVDSSLYVPVLVVDGVTLDLTSLPLPYTASGSAIYLVLVNKGMYASQGNSKFGADASSLIGNLYYVPSVYVADGTYKADRSIANSIGGGTVTDTEAKDVTIVSDGDYLGGFYIADSDYTITNASVSLTGKGGDDFTGIGSAVVATGKANVTINNSFFDTTGVLRSGIWAGGSAKVFINDSVVISNNDFDFVAYNTEDNYATPMMQQVPFALGMTGNIRATLVCGTATNYFDNCLVVSSGWAVLSTDSGSGGLESTNTTAVLGYAEEYNSANEGTYAGTIELLGKKYGYIAGTADDENGTSGYIAYCDGFTDHIYGNTWYAPDYLAIITGGELTFDKSEEVRGYGWSDRIGFMTHQTKGATLKFANSDFEVADSFIITKNKSGNYDNISIENITLNLFGEDAWSGVIYQMMDSDDLGNGPGATSYTIPYYTYEDYLAGTGTPAATTTLSIKDSALSGDIYNATAYYEGASSTGALALTLDGASVEGVISSAYAYHVDAEGKAITGGDDKTFTVDCYTGTGEGGPDGETYDYLTIGRLVNQAAPTRGNNVSVTLTNGSVWTVTGESYVSELTVDDSSKIIGTVTALDEGGYLVTPGKGEAQAPTTTVTAVIPEAKQVVVTSQKLTVDGEKVSPAAYNIDGYNYFKLRDMAAILNGTAAQFGVAYDEATNSITLTTGKGYEKLDSDLAAIGAAGSVIPSPQSVTIDGKAVVLTAYNIDGYNYYKLRDLGDALGFGVDYNEAKATMVVTTPGYVAPVVADNYESTDDMTVSSYSALDPDSSREAKDAGHIYVGYSVVDGALADAESNWKTDNVSAITFDNEVEGAGFTALHASGAATDVTITGSLNLHDDSDGYYASDFTGTGVSVVATDQAHVFATGLDLTTDGFVRAAFISYKGAQVYIDDSAITTYGANPLTEAYSSYANSATTSLMISPPWVLGIQGGIRTINVLGDSATLFITNSKLASGGWGVLSTDGCSNPAIYVVDSELEILAESENGMNSGYALFGYDADSYGSGYGSYVIGNASENFYGVTINGATYGAIAREGTAIYQSSKGDIALVNAQGETADTVTGKGNVSTLNTVFGFLSHSGEDVTIQVKDGTVINTEEATFLYKTSATATYEVDCAELNSKSGILLQMMDDDDSTVGMGDMNTMGFNTSLKEDAGLPSVSGNVTGSDGNSQVVMSLTNGAYCGNLYNGTGYYTQGADVLNLTVGEGAQLSGDVALTQTIHGVKYSPAAIAALKAMGTDVSYVFLTSDFAVTENEGDAAYIQLTSFSINQYYCLGHVLNSLYYNGNSAANVYVTAGGQWTVAEESLITYLKVEEGGTVYGELIENADGTLTLKPSAKALAVGEYGTEKIADTSAASGSNAMSPGMMGGGMEPPGGFGGDPGGGGTPPDGMPGGSMPPQ